MLNVPFWYIHAGMDLRTYFRSLDVDQQEAFARRAGTTANYIRVHLACDPPRRVPRQRLLEGLAIASEGALTVPSLVAYFYQQPLPEQGAA